MNTKKPNDKAMKRPHFYGKRDGVHLFHATMPEHQELVGKHLHDPSDDELKSGIKEAKRDGVSSVVIHGTPPDSLKAKIHDQLGVLSPSQMEKSERSKYRPIRSTEYEIIDEDDHEPLKKTTTAEASTPIANPPQASVDSKPFFNQALLGRKSITTGHKEAVEPGAHRITPLALSHHLKGGSFSLLTAQNPMGQAGTSKSNEEANTALEGDLKSSGAIYHEVRGKYGSNEEQSYMVHHTESVTPDKLQGFAKKYGQESIVHSSQGNHEMVHVNGEHEGKHFKGEGFKRVPNAQDNFSELENHPQKKFSLNFNFDNMHGKAVSPPKANVEVKKGEKIYFDDLNKAFLQPDLSTFTDIKTHTGSLSAAHPSLMHWGTEQLSSLPKDAIETLELDGKTIKVRKHDADLYSGWVEDDGKVLHSFEKVTLPELMVQLQSKMELYGKENSIVTPKESIDDPHTKLMTLIEAYFKKIGMEMPSPEIDTKQKLKSLKSKVDSKLNPDPFDETSADEIKEKKDFQAADKAAREQMLFDEMNEIESQVKEVHEEVIPKKDLAQGLANPAEECADCGSKQPICLCYSGMARPRLIFDGEKVTIFFKSEWAQDDRENFKEDLKLRAGRILRMKHTKKL